MLSSRLDQALLFASELHRTQLRKGSSIPYLIHLLGVGRIALGFGADENTEDTAINETVNPKIKNKNRIQAETYKEIRSRFGLSANLAVRVCARVAANRKVGKPVKSFN